MHKEKESLEFGKCIVALAGPPLVGKSTLGRELAARSNLQFLDIDEGRWKIFPRTERLPESLEGLAMITCYGYNHFRAGAFLIEGTPTIVAATYSRSLYRQMLTGLADSMQAPLRVFLVDVPEDDLERRINTRIEQGNPSAVKDVALAKRLRASYNPISEFEYVRVDTSLPIDYAVETVFNNIADLRTRHLNIS